MESGQRRRDKPLEGNVTINNAEDTLTIFGIRYTGDIFRELAFAPVDADPPRYLRIIKREDGFVTLQVRTDLREPIIRKPN
jgi:hypothetical protein